LKSRSVVSKTPIFILHEITLSKKSIEEITDVISQGGFDVTFINMSSYIPNNLPITDKDHVSIATFFRLYVASVLPQEIESIIYLDSDAIVIRSIKELFDVRLTHPIAAVDHFSLDNQLRLWGECSGNYFQAGVLIIDLVKWRSLDMEVIFSKILKEEVHRICWYDQCILNIAFENNWQRLPLRFNFIQYYKFIDFEANKDLICYLHFAGRGKPWLIFSKNLIAKYWYDGFKDAFGFAFNTDSIKAPLYRQIGLNVKSLIKCAFKCYVTSF
jgi:lipopolysaccharide biosynthesis glycosyltransferase